MVYNIIEIVISKDMESNLLIQEFIRENRRVSGVYAIVSCVTGRTYIGSSVNVGERISGHFGGLKNNTHSNTELQTDFNKLGRCSFRCFLVEQIPSDKLLEREKYWLSDLSWLYNTTPPNRKINLIKQQVARFWSKVDIKGDDECWSWLGNPDKDGYGRISFNDKTYRSNRLAFFLTYPDENTDQIIRHICNNTSCCNPKHLVGGSYQQNTQDMLKYGRKSGQKLNWDIVRQIRDKFLENPHVLQRDLHKWVENKFNVKLPIGYPMNIACNKVWHDENYYPPLRRMNDKIVNKIRIMFNNGTNYKIIQKYLDEKYQLKYITSSLKGILRNYKRKDKNYQPHNHSFKSENNPSSKLNWEIINWMRDYYQMNNCTYVDLSKIIFQTYNVKIVPEQISNIIRNKSWIINNN